MRQDSEITEAKRGAWFNSARSQGLVCLICHEVPPLEDRATFFDTGLCAHCAEELSRRDRAALPERAQNTMGSGEIA
jgi:hypothetical protein